MYEIADGDNQSPVDIKTSDAKYDANLKSKPLSMNYSEEKQLEIVNTGHSVMAKIQETSGKALTSQSELPRPIPWNQTTDVHRGYTLITRVIK